MSLVQATSTELINIGECEMGRTPVQASTSEVHNSSESEMESTSKKLANRTEGAISAPVDRHDSAVVDQIVASVSSPVRDTKWPKRTFKFPKDKGKRKQDGPKWIHSSVDSDSELEPLCSLGSKFAVAIDAQFYLADETTYLPEEISLYDTAGMDISIVPPVEMFSPKKSQLENIQYATIQVEIKYPEEIFEFDTTAYKAFEMQQIEEKVLIFNYDVTGVRVVKRKKQQTLDRYILKPDEWKGKNGKVNLTFAHEPMTGYKYSRETAIGRVSRGVKHLFSGHHSDRFSKRSCNDSVKLVTPEGEANVIPFRIAKKRCSRRTASSKKYLSKFMTPLFRQEMERVEIELKTAKEKLRVKKSLIERKNTFPFKSQPICTKDKERYTQPICTKDKERYAQPICTKDKERYAQPIDVFKPNKKLLVGDDDIYKKKLDLARGRKRKLLDDRLAALKRRALKRDLERIREMKRNYYDAAVSYTCYTSCLYWTSDTETEDGDSDDCYIDYDQYAVEKYFPPEMVEFQNMCPHTHPDDDKIAFLCYLKIYNRTVLPAPADSSWYISTPVFAELDTE